MLGTAIGDIYGSLYEKRSTDSRVLPALSPAHHPTDDTLMSLAVAQHLLTGEPLLDLFRSWVSRYPDAGYGGAFKAWALGDSEPVLVSWANGALMRLGPVVPLSDSLEEARARAHSITASTHGHEVALTAADLLVQLHWKALREGADAPRLVAFYQSTGRTLHTVDSMHDAGSPMRLRADETLDDVMSCLAESQDFESLIGNCLYHGGDSDTIAAIAGSLAEALWGVPATLSKAIEPFLPADVKAAFQQLYEALERKGHAPFPLALR